MSARAVKTSLPSLTDVGDITRLIQGHVGQSVNQTFTIKRRRSVNNTQLRLQAVEIITKDQFGNVYVLFLAELLDREVHAVADWVGVEKWEGAKRRFRPVKEYRPHFRALDDAMLSFLQDRAFIAFGRSTLEILKGRHAGNMPMVPLHEEPAVAEIVSIAS